MVKRSLRASPTGIQRAKRAFALKGWTQDNLAGEVNLKTRQPIWRFFTGQPVDRQIFMEICSILDLNWRETALDPPAAFSEPGETVETTALEDIDALVQQVPSTYHDTIQNQCGILQLLDVNCPVSLDDIYVDVNILEEIASQQQVEIVVTPLFLHLACWVFQEQSKFPTKRTEFYKQGLDLLLGQWDEAKGVERDQVYRGFLLPQKLRLLSQLAAVTFEQGQYFFEQRTMERYIGDYLRNLPGAILEPEELQLQSEAMLNAIEAQHGLLIERARGIFSFSYLAFQEYFTARKIVASHNLRALEQTLGGLVNHITDSHWREVFLLTASMLRSADSLVQLMKQQIDALVAQDPYLQEFLMWASQKSQTISTETKLATARSFYLALAQSPPTAAHFALASTLDQGMFLDAALENLLLEFATDHSQNFAYVNACSSALNNILVMVLDTGFYKSLQQLKDQLPSASQNRERLQDWWQENYAAWVEQLRESIAHYRNIHHFWQFTPEQRQVLQRYYDANQLLVDCLNSNCEVTAVIRQGIEDTLFLPQKELEEQEWQGG